MKKILIVFSMLAFSYVGFAQSEKYTAAMTSNITLLDSAKSADDLLAASAAFERIGDAEKNQWLPYYYAALAQISYSFVKGDPQNNDALADKTEQLLNKAEALEKNNSEISCLKALVATARMIVNPMQRWQQYGPLIEQALEEAKKQDPTNPRPYALKGDNLKQTPEQFGGGCGTAKPVLEEAVKKYDAFKPASSLHPHWGRQRVESLLAECK